MARAVGQAPIRVVVRAKQVREVIIIPITQARSCAVAILHATKILSVVALTKMAMAIAMTRTLNVVTAARSNPDVLAGMDNDGGFSVLLLPANESSCHPRRDLAGLVV